jgi:NAD(P)-dependent dehydrogenase (short-subunit alcohol dehydrogenase family)
MDMLAMLEGKRILITGAASGIGAAAAQCFSQYGAELILMDCNPELIARAANYKNATTVLADISDRQQLSTVFPGLGRLDAAFLNAGIEGMAGRMTPLDTYPDEEFDRVQSVNTQGLWNCLKQVIPKLKANNGGAVVATSSVMGWLGAPGMSAYIASKHAVIGLVRASAIDFASCNIRVNALLPGAIETPMLTERGFIENPGFAEHAAKAHPLGRLGQALEVAEAAAWLLSDKSSFITGHALAVDGGLSAI